jgi:hypothetical protein
MAEIYTNASKLFLKPINYGDTRTHFVAINVACKILIKTYASKT